MRFVVLLASLVYCGNVVLCHEKELVEDLLNIIFKLKKNGSYGAGRLAVPAFTVTLSKDLTPQVNQIIKFDSVKTNIGGHYSPSTGIFTAPRNGLYMISATTRANGSNYLHCEMQVNGEMKEKLFGTSASTGTANAVLQLKKGDNVFIKKDHRGRENMMGKDWSMFSGCFIA
ncbi:complement C1q subcomponent subunit C-like [Mytilus californianus]|uniref:complement C1q subcomponent subunit C-like n=1 Tax=Mytilus californianus TaxID=6549 RepID=UPI002247861C|nr:complement C1q subcomponent subunit C-like [Mytilus californianus]